MAEVAEAVALLGALREQVAAVTEHGRGLLRRLRGGGLRTDKGLSLLGVRAQALLQYLGDLGLLLATKCRGGALGALPALPRLLETRLVLEKSRPMELRLRYHLDKLLRAAAAGAPGANDPLRFRPQPGNMGVRKRRRKRRMRRGRARRRPRGWAGGGATCPPASCPCSTMRRARSGSSGRWRRRGAVPWAAPWCGSCGTSWATPPRRWAGPTGSAPRGRRSRGPGWRSPCWCGWARRGGSGRSGAAGPWGRPPWAPSPTSEPPPPSWAPPSRWRPRGGTRWPRAGGAGGGVAGGDAEPRPPPSWNKGCVGRGSLVRVLINGG